MASWNWITSKIALGSAPLRSEIPAMRSQGITDVLDLRGEPREGETGPQPAMYQGTGINYHYVGMLDRGGVEPADKYQQGIGIMAAAINGGGKILVHCAGGISRSPSMVYAYLRSMAYSPDRAWQTIVTARPVASRQYVQYAEAAITGHSTSGSSNMDSKQANVPDNYASPGKPSPIAFIVITVLCGALFYAAAGERR